MNKLRAHLLEAKDGNIPKVSRLAQRPPRSKKAEARAGHDWNEGFCAVN